MKLLSRITMSCEHAAGLASQSLDRKLTFGERVQLAFHHMICVWCKRYHKQVHGIHDILQEAGDEATDHLEMSLSEAARNRLESCIHEGRRDRPGDRASSGDADGN